MYGTCLFRYLYSSNFNGHQMKMCVWQKRSIMKILTKFLTQKCICCYSHYWNSVKEDIEEQRKIVEGADALLNLAGITTCNMRKRSSSIDEQRNLKQQCVEPMPTLRSRSLRKEKATSVNFKESISMPNHLNQMYEDENVDSENNNDNDDDSDNTKCNFNNRIIENKLRTLKSRPTVTSSRRLRKKIEKKRFKM